MADRKDSIAEDLLRYLGKSPTIVDKPDIVVVDNSLATRIIREKNIWKFICGIK